MKIVLQRKDIGSPYTKNGRTERGTFGKIRVYIGRELHIWQHPQTKNTRDYLWTMENENEGAQANMDLRIPASENYWLNWSSTAKKFVPPKYRGTAGDGRNETILICDKTNQAFASRRILIHVGNSAIDTAGCILLGWGRNSDIITESTLATEMFYDLMKKHKIEEFSFHIINAFKDDIQGVNTPIKPIFDDDEVENEESQEQNDSKDNA